MDVTSPINRLLPGIASRHVETTRDAWRALLNDGDTSTQAILAKLDSPSWAEPPRGPSAEYLGILLAALNEIDPDTYVTEIERLQRSTLHPLHLKTLEVMQARMSDQPLGDIAHHIPVYVSEKITDRQSVYDTLRKWSGTNGLSLKNVTRVDVVAEDGQKDYLGKYSLYFSSIILVWPEPSPSRLVSWVLNRRVEHTFYHEVGHHVSGHLEGGSVVEQEKEANAFALKMMCRAHPFISLGVLLFYLPAIKVTQWYRELLEAHPKRKRHS